MISEPFTLEIYNKKVLEGKAAWWQMTLPSGYVVFGKTKTDMIGYEEADFKHYEDFTKLLHKDDYERVMQDMRDHLEGKKEFYETEYRIKHKSGEYIHFYDCGRVIKRDDEGVVLRGFVVKISEDSDIKKQIKEFRDPILQSITEEK